MGEMLIGIMKKYFDNYKEVMLIDSAEVIMALPRGLDRILEISMRNESIFWRHERNGMAIKMRRVSYSILFNRRAV